MPREKAAPTRIQKSGRGHTYYLDGERVPGVTSILSAGVPKPGLMNWSADILAEFVVERLDVVRSNETGRDRVVADRLVEDAIAWNSTREKPAKVSNAVLPRTGLLDILPAVRYRDLDAAANRGTEVHNLAHRLAHGEQVDVPEPIGRHVDSYLRFLEEWGPLDALVERVVLNRRWRYMGKFDLNAHIPRLPDWLAERVGKSEGRGLFDIKTARSGIFAEVALQLEAYRRCETMLDGRDEVPAVPVDFVAAIHVRADGYDVYAFDIETERRPTTFDIFLYCKMVGEWLDWKDDTSPASTIRSPSLHIPPVDRPRAVS